MMIIRQKWKSFITKCVGASQKKGEENKSMLPGGWWQAAEAERNKHVQIDADLPAVDVES